MQARARARGARIHPSVQLAQGVVIEADDLELGEGVVIGERTVLRAARVRIGPGTRIGERVSLSGFDGGPAERLEFGHQGLLGDDCRLALPTLVCGDFVTVHRHGLLNGRRPMVIGHNGWIGEHCVLNADSTLWIGNHVGIGAYSSVYTHAYWGDELEGCTLNRSAPVVLEDDTWIVGSYTVIGPGSHVRARGTILPGSVVTGPVAAGAVVAGAPAREVRRAEPLYVRRSPAERLALMSRYLDEFVAQQRWDVERTDGAWWMPDAAILLWVGRPPEPRPAARFALGVVTAGPRSAVDGEGLIDLGSRSYRPTRHPVEVRLLRFLRSHRARFVPADHPVVAPELRPAP